LGTHASVVTFAQERIMKSSRLPFALAIILPLAAAACEDDDEVEFAVYRATLAQINPQFSSTIPAAVAEIILEDDDAIQVRVEGLGLDVVNHPIFLRTGANCPTALADANGDGLIDVVEGQVAYGSVLLPLDANLTTQFIEPGTFPAGGSFSYFELEELDDVLDAIDGPDQNPNDFLVPLAPGENLELASRTIVVHGVGALLLPTPHTIAGLDGMEIAETVPVLCGRLSLVGAVIDD
jgi:hypothetical protein